MATGTLRILTHAQIDAVHAVIMEKMAADDRHPYEVIDDPEGPYFGDRNHYYSVMAKYHNVDLDAVREPEGSRQCAA